MKRIEEKKQKEILVDILKYFDSVCRKNNIEYSLIGGSLIGAIRHKGMIPWDDDIDVILSKENFEKLIKVFEKENGKYKLLTQNSCAGYYYPFPKLVNTETYLVEEESLEQINEYGIFVDIFYYVHLPNDDKKIRRVVKKMKFLNNLLVRKKINYKKYGVKKNVLRFIKNALSKIIGYKTITEYLNNMINLINQPESDYVICNWPMYDINKEIQESKDIADYINVPFEDIDVMIFRNFDKILKTTYGDYMQLPPEEKRKKHGLVAYWRSK